MEAVARSRRRDAGLEALLERRQSNHEAGPSNSDNEEVHLLLWDMVLLHPLPPALHLASLTAGHMRINLACSAIAASMTMGTVDMSRVLICHLGYISTLHGQW